MSIGMQKRILRTTGISLSTMLLLVLAQALIQIILVFDVSRQLAFFVGICPLVALISGMLCRYLAGSVWSAVSASTSAFTIFLLVLFRDTSLLYAPLYVLVSLLGYLLATYLDQRKAK